MLSALSTALFRPEAIEHLNTIEHDTIEGVVIKPNHWLLLLSCVCIMVAIITWGILGNITLAVEAPGIVLTSQQISEAETNIKQAEYERNNRVGELFDLYNKKLALFNKHYITRVDLLKAKDDYLTAKNELFTNTSQTMTAKQSNENDNQLMILSFVSQHDGKKLIPGMPVHLLLNPHSGNKSPIKGEIVSVSQYPITKQLAQAYLHNSSLVDNYFSNGAPFLTKIKFVKSFTASNPIEVGSIITSKTNYKTCKPIYLLLKSKNCD